MVTEVETLLLRLESTQTKFEKQMQTAYRSAEKASRQIEGRFAKMNRGVSASFASVGAALGKLGLGGLAAGGIAGLVTGFRNVASSVALIGDEARRAGVSVEAFQELRYVAEQSRIGVDSLTDGLKELSLRADEFITTGKGPAAEAFGRLGIDAETLKEKLKDPSVLFSEIIGKLGQLDTAAQIRIADEIFGGTGGEKFVQLIGQGEAGIRDTIQAARDLGIVIDADLVERAAEVDRRFNAIANTVGQNLKSAIVSAADSLGEFIDGFRAFENQQSRSLQNRLTEIGAERLAIERQILELTDQQRQNTSVIAAAEGKVLQGQIKSLQDQSSALNADEARILGILKNRPGEWNRNGDRTWTPPPPVLPTTGGTARENDYAREVTQIREHTAALQAEVAMMAGIMPMIDDFAPNLIQTKVKS
ncbi:hypothetical protein [Hoeflea alexandrii]